MTEIMRQLNDDLHVDDNLRQVVPT